ncbi:hypothetical protein EV193_10656 [Herbihabitans rhizosphaerae]|uniref:Uncharacterized protein n=1 Tax=Herbihabitans rhizosphaerae TaxID=1872711 RepID=A0A4Q7KNL8_9PSEU|nr:hypothetical protein [Herbihabitans rhizosphaerae]RZS36822.1 hypothetical protein EV193_10656 [Herbihabitans rhizosphaerae]
MTLSGAAISGLELVGATSIEGAAKVWVDVVVNGKVRETHTHDLTATAFRTGGI